MSQVRILSPRPLILAGSLANSSSLLPDEEKRHYAQESRARQVIAHETDSVVRRELRGDVRSKRSAQDPRQIERKRRARIAYGSGKQRSKRASQAAVRTTNKRQADCQKYEDID